MGARTASSYAWRTLPDQRLTVRQAVGLYTTGPAALSRSQNDLGTLEAGKLADLVVLDRDLFPVPKEEIRKIPVVLIMVGGWLTFDGRTGGTRGQ